MAPARRLLAATAALLCAALAAAVVRRPTGGVSFDLAGNSAVLPADEVNLVQSEHSRGPNAADVAARVDAAPSGQGLSTQETRDRIAKQDAMLHNDQSGGIACPRDCLGNGRCVNGKCYCARNWEGVDCGTKRESASCLHASSCASVRRRDAHSHSASRIRSAHRTLTSALTAQRAVYGVVALDEDDPLKLPPIPRDSPPTLGQAAGAQHELRPRPPLTPTEKRAAEDFERAKAEEAARAKAQAEADARNSVGFASALGGAK
jgi:hypothetical protein